MTDILKKLAEPFPPSLISWRVGPVDNRDNPTKGIALAYVDARDVQDRLNAVCGTNWQSRYPHAAQKTVCEIGVKVDNEWIWRADGAGDTDMEAEKGSLSDAFKRAAVKWGVGRYLYDVNSPWVAVVKKGKSVVIAEHEFVKLEKLLPGSKAETAKAAPDHGQMQGPLNITGLKAEMRELARELEACTDGDMLNALVLSKKAEIDQCRRDLPEWYFGKPGGDVKGLQDRIEQLTKEFSQQKAAE